MRPDNALLLDMLLAAQKVQRFAAGLSQEEFNNAEIVQSAVLREIQVIGEAARMMSEANTKKHTDIPWRVIAGMRNRVIHEYFDVDLDILWETVKVSIPALAKQLAPLVPEED